MPDPGSLGRLLDVEAIKRLKARYCRLLDLRDWAEWRALFTDDAECLSPAARARLGENIGVDDFVAYVRETQGARDAAHGGALTAIHHAHSPEIEFNGTNAARAVWRLSTLHPPAEPNGTIVYGHGLYYDVYRRDGGIWKISAVTLVLLREDSVPGEAHFRRLGELDLPWAP